MKLQLKSNSLLAFHDAFIVVAILHLIQARNKLVESFTINDQTCYALSRIRYDICRAEIIAKETRKCEISVISRHDLRKSDYRSFFLPLQSFLSEEVAFAERSDEFLLERVVRSNRHFDLSLRDDEKCVASCTLTNDVIALLIVAFFQHIGDLDERIIWKIFKDGNTGKEN